MILQEIQDITSLEDIKPLRGYKPLTTIKVSTLNIPSTPELLLLSANLNYQAKRILDNEVKCKSGLCADSYIYQSIAVMRITEDYANKYISYKELREIKKQFGINTL
ncbi:MAG: hypothetical protein COA39_003760 [Sulfurimonas sp.]|nr:hypothetical protein [Sulfurimonas sp.]